MEQADQITAASKSNLALAFLSLPRERRRDMNVFYAFCRIVDDLADDPVAMPEAKRAGLDAWRRALRADVPDAPPLARQVRVLLGKYPIPAEHLEDILRGVEMDLVPARYETFEDLALYCHRVACVVGLVSIEIFGYRDPGCRQYALSLGMALQLTNILRDVAADLRNGGRIYLPMEDLARFGVAGETLRAGTPGPGFLPLMEFQAERAAGYFREAEAALPAGDRKSMVAAEIMHGIYAALLRKMRRDRFRVFDKTYRLSALSKCAIILTTMARCKWL